MKDELIHLLIMIATLIRTSVNGKNDLQQIIDSMLLAFSTDPFFRWIYPCEEQYLAIFPGFVKLLINDYIDINCTKDLEGAAFWLPPQQEINPNTSTAKQKQIEVSESDRQATATKKKRSPLPFLGLAMLAIVGMAGWKTFNVSEDSSEPASLEQPTQAGLPVRAVRSQLKPIEAWVFNNGEVAPIRFKHLTFQTAGTINYLKQIEGRDLREGDVVKGGDLLAKIDQRKLDADITVAVANQVEARKGIHSLCYHWFIYWVLGV